MSLGTLLKVGKAIYDTVDKAAQNATWDKDILKNTYNKAKDNLNKSIQKKKEDSMTFDLSQVKSTVVNPSQKFKWISVEDENKIMRLVKQMYPNGNEFETNQAIQGLYTSALKEQKKKDIEAWRQSLKLDLLNKAENSKTKKEKNEYNTQVKRADLADLIKQQLSQDWYNINNIMNLTDEWVIVGFLNTNPEYQDSFNKFLYNNQDAISLGKELWWIEKDWWDKAWDIIKSTGKWLAWWIPKFWEWVDDTLWLSNKDESWFLNFVQEKYWTAPANLTSEDYRKAKAEYSASDKKQYQPSLYTAWTKLAEWLIDIMFTSWWLWALRWESMLAKEWLSNTGKYILSDLWKKSVRNTTFKAWLWAAAETPYVNVVPNTLWEWLSRWWEYINKAPILKDIRDNLPEKDRAEWDAFVAGNVLWLWKKTAKWLKTGTKIAINLDEAWKANAIEQAKQWNFKAAWNMIKDNVESNIQEWLNKKKLEQAQKVTQWAFETQEQQTKALDELNSQWKLEKVKNADDLLKITDEAIDTLKREQEDVAKNRTYKNISSKELQSETPTEVYSKAEWKKVMRTEVEQPFMDLIDNIIEHYEKVDNSKARTYKSYKMALEDWWLPADIILEIKRHGNYLHQRDYNSKTWLIKDADKSKKWDANITKVNNVIEKLNIWEELRSRDAKLSSFYTVKSSLERLQSAAAELKKKMPNDSWGKTIGKVLNKLTFWATWILQKFLVSAVQWAAEWRWLLSDSYNAVQLTERIPEFVKEYRQLVDKIEKNPAKKWAISQAVSDFASKWNYLAEPYSDNED